jgi:hypothetical protein
MARAVVRRSTRCSGDPNQAGWNSIESIEPLPTTRALIRCRHGRGDQAQQRDNGAVHALSEVRM